MGRSKGCEMERGAARLRARETELEMAQPRAREMARWRAHEMALEMAQPRERGTMPQTKQDQTVQKKGREKVQETAQSTENEMMQGKVQLIAHTTALGKAWPRARGTMPQTIPSMWLQTMLGMQRPRVLQTNGATRWRRNR
jgi:hypothetical protein